MSIDSSFTSFQPGNVASVKLLEKLGFHNEGLLKEYENWGSKGFTDLCMLGLTKTMWNAKASPGKGD
jgi:ribosomal-protein-alanine N-acetyltransferase